MDARDIQIVNLMQKAIDRCASIASMAEAAGKTWLVESARHAISLLENGQRSARERKLPRPSNGAGLHLVRTLGEWADEFPDLMDMALQIDQFYSVECNCSRVDS